MVEIQGEKIKPPDDSNISSNLRKPSISSMARILWEDLPPELLEIVLTCLPAHVLCRFRLVCKSWYHLITQPGFASLHAQAPRQASYVLTLPKLLYCHPSSTETRTNWEILETAEKRFYTLNDSFITDNIFDHMLHRNKDLRFEFRIWGWYKYTLAANGGLIYAIYAAGDGTGFRRHIVCNPVSKSFHEIMDPGLPFLYESDIVVMSVDNATKSYRIITIEAYDSTVVSLVREEVHLYDSTTTQWRKLCEVPHKHRAYSSIFLKGVFYTLFVDTSVVPWYPKLYSCDLETGEWSYIDVGLPQPSCQQDKSQLVVSLGRLLVVEYTGLPTFPSYDLMTAWESLLARSRVRKKHLIKVSIWEILLDKKEFIKVAEMPKYSKYPRWMVEEDRPQAVMGEPVVAVGCADSIVISSMVGRPVGFDLLRNCWHDLPASTQPMPHPKFCRDGAKCVGIHAGLVHLDLREMRH